MKKHKGNATKTIIGWSLIVICLLMGLGSIKLLQNTMAKYFDSKFIQTFILMVIAFIPLLIYFAMPYVIKYYKLNKSIDRDVESFFANLKDEEQTVFIKIALDFQSGSIKGIFKILKNITYKTESSKIDWIIMQLVGMYNNIEVTIRFLYEHVTFSYNDEELIYKYEDFSNKQKMYEALIARIRDIK